MAAHKSRRRKRFRRYLKKNLSVKDHTPRKRTRDRKIIPIKPIYIEEEEEK